VTTTRPCLARNSQTAVRRTSSHVVRHKTKSIRPLCRATPSHAHYTIFAQQDAGQDRPRARKIDARADVAAQSEHAYEAELGGIGKQFLTQVAPRHRRGGPPAHPARN